MLKNRELCYYKIDKEGNTHLNGALNFDQYRATVVEDKSKSDLIFEIKLLNCDEKFIFRPPREEVKLDHGIRC